MKGNWNLKENWSVQKVVLCSPAGVKPALKFTCKSFFEDEEGYKTLMEGLKLCDESELDEMGPKAEHGVVTYPGCSMHMQDNQGLPMTPPPRGSLKKTLSRNASKALAQLQKQQR